MIKIIKVDIYEKNQIVPSGAFPVMMLEVPDFPPFAGNISNIVNPVHAAVIACNKFDDVGGWAFCDLQANEKTAIGEALVEYGAKFGAWYMAAWYMTEMGDEGKYTSCTEVLDDWFNGANIQGVAAMETVELAEMLECMRDIESQRNEQLQARVNELEGRGECPDCGIKVNLLGTVEIPACYCPDENCAWASWLTPPSEDES